ncbi:hypothetical protein F5Y13DRAFT_187934 [Hypoxylon sp. FL1857]|nr:hypothetical protein F5Y13DRAFT_187934 [Hypoxylon sp. FL1857]
MGIPSASRPLSEASEFDNATASASALPTPRAKRVKPNTRDSEPSVAGEMEQLRDTIRAMEDEFKEILKTERKNHKLEISTLQDKHQEELNNQRERYESRIDDLIKIMRKM